MYGTKLTIGNQNAKCSTVRKLTIGIQNAKSRKLTFGMQSAVNWELKSKCKIWDVQKDLESEIILKSIKCKFYEVITFISKACQLSLSQVQVFLHFSWRKYTLTQQVAIVTAGGIVVTSKLVNIKKFKIHIRHVLKCDSTKDGTLVQRFFSPWQFISSWVHWLWLFLHLKHGHAVGLKCGSGSPLTILSKRLFVHCWYF